MVKNNSQYIDLQKGASYSFAFQITDSNGAAQVLTIYSNIILIIKTYRGETIEQYSRETLAGYNDTDFDQRTQTGSNIGFFDIYLQAEKTKSMLESPIYFIIKTQQTDAKYTDSKLLQTIVLYNDSDFYGWRFVDNAAESIATLT